MKAKLNDLLMAAVFVVFLFGFLAAALLTPDQPFSEYERRRLAEFPKPSWKSVQSTVWMDNFETYTLDQFPFRQTFRGAKSILEFYGFAKLDMEGLYIQNGYLSKQEYPLSERQVTSAAGKLSGIHAALFPNNRVYYSVIPDKNYFLADEAKKIDYDRLMELFSSGMSGTYIDIFDTLTIEDYYKTDTHFRQENLVDTADRILRGMDADYVLPDYERELLTDSFCGVYVGQFALKSGGEPLYVLHSSDIDGAKAENYETGASGGVYTLDALETYDPYGVYLYGSAALVTVTNPNQHNGRELILFRDSFGSSIAPLLLCGYEKITLVDIRYVTPSILPQVLEYDDTADVLFLYSTLLLNSSSTLRGM